MPTTRGMYPYETPAYGDWSVMPLDYSDSWGTDLARGGHGPFLGWTGPVPMRMGQLATGWLDWMAQTGPPRIGMPADFEERQYEQMGRMMERQRQTQDKAITDMFAREGRAGTPQHQSAMLASMYGTQQTLGDMIQKSAIQNALRRLEEQKAMGQLQLGMSQIVGDWASHPMPGWRPSENKSSGGGIGGFLGQTLGSAIGSFFGGGGSLSGLFGGSGGNSGLMSASQMATSPW